MISVSLPQKPKFEEIEKNAGRFVIESCYPGYGITLGNTLRRVLLSSLSGSAITSVKIKGITHEFTTIKGVKEDVVQIILNLKQIYFKLDENTEEAVLTLKIKGEKEEKEVSAKDIKCPSNVEISNKDQKIATLTSSTANLEMEIKVEKGLGYVPAESQEKKEKEIGSIVIDAIFNPILRVNYSIDNMRVGKRTDYDKVTLDIYTDGTISPQEAYEQSVEILMSQFNAISNLKTDNEEEKTVEGDIKEESKNEVEKDKKIGEKEEKEEISKIPVDELNLSTRTKNILDDNKLNTVGEIAKYSENSLREMDGMGDKCIKEIKKGISKFGIILKSEEE